VKKKQAVLTYKVWKLRKLNGTRNWKRAQKKKKKAAPFKQINSTQGVFKKEKKVPRYAKKPHMTPTAMRFQTRIWRGQREKSGKARQGNLTKEGLRLVVQVQRGNGRSAGNG